MIRSHEAGTLRPEHVGQQVTLAGWVARRRDHGGVVFIDLRDASGVVQVVLRHSDADGGITEGGQPAADSVAHELRAEYCIKVTGNVSRRPAGNENLDLPTGEIEVLADAAEVLSDSAPLPFPIEEIGRPHV